jgi:hypothetical protein
MEGNIELLAARLQKSPAVGFGERGRSELKNGRPKDVADFHGVLYGFWFGGVGLRYFDQNLHLLLREFL